MPNIQAKNQPRLWFDVGRERDTTDYTVETDKDGCGLM